MSCNVYTIKIAGPAGAGIKSSGQVLAKTLISLGFHIFDYTEYPSLVRGGYNAYFISFSQDKVYSIHKKVDFDVLITDYAAEAAKLGNPLTANVIALGSIAYVFGIDLDALKKIVSIQYGKYAEINLKAVDMGFEYAGKNLADKKIEIEFPKSKVELANNYNDGNEAFGWGFLKGEGNFYAAYPMTPATGTLHFLAAKQEEYKITVIHPEDEIAAINIVSGAAFAGARAATGSSGGGFALMTEALSFAGVAEIGLVVYLVSRPGPATGLPTWTAQGDILYAIHAGHGDFPKIVISPATHQESFEFGVKALNLAAKYQVPVIVVSDKMLGESAADTRNFALESVKVEHANIETKPTAPFKRYSLETKTGVSPQTLPGTKDGEYLSNSYEHDEFGYSTEDSEMTTKMSEKRHKKLAAMLPDLPKAELSNESAKKLIIAWGSVAATVKEAKLSNYALLQIKTLWPIDQEIKKIIDKYKDITVIENNQTSQLTTLLKSQFDFNPTKIITKFDGRPFFPEELNEKLK